VVLSGAHLPLHLRTCFATPPLVVVILVLVLVLMAVVLLLIAHVYFVGCCALAAVCLSTEFVSLVSTEATTESSDDGKNSTMSKKDVVDALKVSDEATERKDGCWRFGRFCVLDAHELHRDYTMQ